MGVVLGSFCADRSRFDPLEALFTFGLAVANLLGGVEMNEDCRFEEPPIFESEWVVRGASSSDSSESTKRSGESRACFDQP